jgi:hypothetical protein
MTICAGGVAVPTYGDADVPTFVEEVPGTPITLDNPPLQAIARTITTSTATILQIMYLLFMV